MDIRQPKNADVEEPSLVSPAASSGKGLVSNLENRARNVVVTIPQSANDEEHHGMSTSIRSSTTDVPQSSTTTAPPKAAPLSRGLPLTKHSLVAPEPKLLHP